MFDLQKIVQLIINCLIYNKLFLENSHNSYLPLDCVLSEKKGLAKRIDQLLYIYKRAINTLARREKMKRKCTECTYMYESYKHYRMMLNILIIIKKIIVIMFNGKMGVFFCMFLNTNKFSETMRRAWLH